MRISNETDLIPGYVVTSREPPTPEMVLVVRGTYLLDEAGQLVPVSGPLALLDQGKMDADSYTDGDDERVGVLLRATDFAHYKPKAEVLVYGSCHLPSRVEQCQLTVQVGNWAKTLVVSGDRRWLEDDKASRPALFDEMPLDFRRGFGGEGVIANPVGIGQGDGRLPNLEYPEDRMGRREARPAPASFGAINPQWPVRESKRGTKYGVDYLKRRAPYHAEDFDWSFFQAAPSDQWIPGGYLKGDEKVLVENLWASHPRVESRLPGVRLRCFLADDQGPCRELKMNLDTVAFEGDEERVILTWRGLLPVTSRDLEEVTHLIVAKESMAEPARPVSEYEEKMRLFVADPTGYQRLVAELMEVDAIEGADPLTKRLLEEKMPIPAEVQQSLKEMWEATEAAGQDPHKIIEKMDEARAGEVPDEPPPAIPGYPDELVRVFLRPQLQEVRNNLARFMEGRPPDAPLPPEVEAVEKKINHPKLLELDPTLREISDGEPGPGADLSGQDLSDRDLSGANLRGAKLDGCVCIRTNFEGADLTGASFAGAMLFKAKFDRAFMSETNLSRCNGAYASFVRAELDRSKLDYAYFGHAQMQGVRMNGAEGYAANFTEADLTDAQATGLKLKRTLFEQAMVGKADFSESELEECRYNQAKGLGARFDGATLPDIVFNEGDFTEASFVGANLERSLWLDAILHRVDLTGTVMEKAHFTKADLADARLEGANLRDARFYRTGLERTDLSRSNLHGADLSKARLHTTKFIEANLYDAVLIDAKGPDCDFRGANLVNCRYEEGA